MLEACLAATRAAGAGSDQEESSRASERGDGEGRGGEDETKRNEAVRSEAGGRVREFHSFFHSFLHSFILSFFLPFANLGAPHPAHPNTHAHVTTGSLRSHSIYIHTPDPHPRLPEDEGSPISVCIVANTIFTGRV